MSSTNDTFHHLLVQTEPKSILKKSPSPRFLDTSVSLDKDYNSNVIVPSSYENDKHDINKYELSYNHIYLPDDNQFVEKDNLTLTPSSQLIMTLNENLYPNEINHRLTRPIPCADSSSSAFASDDEQHKRSKIKSKKLYSRPLIVNGTVSSSDSPSDNNDERKAKRSVVGSKITLIRSDKHQQKDMQLDEFMRKYQQHGGIHVPTEEDHGKEQMTSENLSNNDGNNYHQSSITPQSSARASRDPANDDTISLLKSLDTITLSSKSLSPLQLLFDVARTSQCDRRTKIDHIRQYVEEQIGISAFLTIYKLIKSSQIPIDLRQKPFCYYANFIPHLCCLILLESEQQKTRL